MEFKEFRSKISPILKEPQEIKNWTNDRGFLGKGDFTAVMKEKYIECDAPDAKTIQKVPEKDFHFMFENWDDYINGRIRRPDLRDQSRFTKYTISIIHHFKHLLN